MLLPLSKPPAEMISTPPALTLSAVIHTPTPRLAMNATPANTGNSRTCQPGINWYQIIRVTRIAKLMRKSTKATITAAIGTINRFPNKGADFGPFFRWIVSVGANRRADQGVVHGRRSASALDEIVISVLRGSRPESDSHPRSTGVPPVNTHRRDACATTYCEARLR